MNSKEHFMPESMIEIEKKPVKILKGMPGFFEMCEDDREQLDIDKFPQYLTINLATSCPYNCLKCVLPGRNREMGQPLSLEEQKNILDIAAKIGIKELVIIGAGEPSSAKNFEDIMRTIIETAYSKGIGTIMFTTAFGINREQAEFLKDHDATVLVSLDSLNPDTYKKLTGTGNLSKILENIQILRSVYQDTQKILPDGKN